LPTSAILCYGTIRLAWAVVLGQYNGVLQVINKRDIHI
jgi:hypothetical protein